MDMGMAAADQDEILCDRCALLHRRHYARAAGFAPFSVGARHTVLGGYRELMHLAARHIERFRRARRLIAVERWRPEPNLPTRTRPTCRSSPASSCSTGMASLPAGPAWPKTPAAFRGKSCAGGISIVCSR